MAILSTDIKFLLSGGAVNTDVNLALGGIPSSTEIVDSTLHNLFDIVYGAEALVGDVEYRCIYILNDHATLTLQTALTWISVNTPSTASTIDIGLGTSAVSGTEQTVVDESTPPVGVTFTSPSTLLTGLAIGDLIPSATKALWIRRTITAAAGPYDLDTVTINAGGDTAA